ncbi:MAG: hypothetical protein KME42_17120 [Tildeniella nuda ZEHNDER 1965/U140]|jgi:hypothetical protein|nr:hypothetical protein [Tildeniella nuda ZEHNDER 1965/U140]
MQSQITNDTQITIYYLNGQTETYTFSQLADPAALEQEVQQEIRRILDKDWWFFHLADQTVCVNRANVSKIELKPAIAQIHGEGVFANAQRVTALNRAHT